MSAPCGGCPPCCNQCPFSGKAEAHSGGAVTEVVSSKAYGCAKGARSVVIDEYGTLGLMSSDGFHPITAEGSDFLQSTGNSLAAFC